MKALFSLEAELLMGRIMASSKSERSETEWPPHPARLFSALVSAYEECDLGIVARQSLEWLEKLPPPEIYADPPVPYLGSDHRGSADVFVPVNDESALPISRKRQPRRFPAFSPNDPRIWYIWNTGLMDEDHISSLQRIAENVTYLGSSMSPVRVRIDYSPPPATLAPDKDGKIMIRTVAPGRLKHLEHVYSIRVKTSTIQPNLGRVTPYRVLKTTITYPVDSLLQLAVLFRLETKNFPIEKLAAIVSTIRKSIMSVYPEPIPEVISGHTPEGGISKATHLTLTGFPNVGYAHSDGHILGFGLWLPSNTQSNVMDELRRACSGIQSLKLGNLGVIKLNIIRPSQEEDVPLGMRPSIYTEPHAVWASVTPVIFGKFPKKSRIGIGRDGGKVIAEMCLEAGLPTPVEIRLGPVSAFKGAGKSSDFVPPEKYVNRFKANIVVRFPTPVVGPVILGVGRYLGFGLCKPWKGE